MIVSSNFMLVTPVVKAFEPTRQFQLGSSVKIGGQAKQRDTHKLILCLRGGLGVSSAALLAINEPTRDTWLCFQRSSEQSSHFCQTWDNQTPSPGKSAFVSSTAHLLSLIDKFGVIKSGKYLFLSLEQEAHPVPSHVFLQHCGKTATGSSTISEQLFDPHSLPSSPGACVPCSECIRCMLCSIFSESGSLSPSNPRLMAPGAASVHFVS